MDAMKRRRINCDFISCIISSMISSQYHTYAFSKYFVKKSNYCTVLFLEDVNFVILVRLKG